MVENMPMPVVEDDDEEEFAAARFATMRFWAMFSVVVLVLVLVFDFDSEVSMARLTGVLSVAMFGICI